MFLTVQMSTTVLQTSYKIHSLQRKAVKCILSASIQSWWLHGLRCVFAAACLLKLQIWIPPEAWISVCCERCVLLGGDLCDLLIPRPKESYWLRCITVSSIYLMNQEAVARIGPQHHKKMWHNVSSQALMLDLLLIMLSSLRQ